MTSAPASAPVSDSASAPFTVRMMPAPLSASARLPNVAPAASKSASAMKAASPAPLSTATSAPSAANFFTVSGIAAQRDSPAASFRTAIFMDPVLPVGLDEHQPEQADDQAPDRAPLQQFGEPGVIADVDGNVLRRRAGEQRFFFVSH